MKILFLCKNNPFTTKSTHVVVLFYNSFEQAAFSANKTLYFLVEKESDNHKRDKRNTNGKRNSYIDGIKFLLIIIGDFSTRP